VIKIVASSVDEKAVSKLGYTESYFKVWTSVIAVR
jgi:hypothetical protein